MTQIFGNHLAQKRTTLALSSPLYPIAIIGPQGVGKFTYVSELLGPTTFRLISKCDVESFRDMFRDDSQSSNTILLDNFCTGSEPFFDACLKQFEESIDLRYVCIIHDEDKVPTTIMSRYRSLIRWDPIDFKDLNSVFPESVSRLVYNYRDALYLNSHDTLIRFVSELSDPKCVFPTSAKKVLTDKSVLSNRKLLAHLFKVASRLNPSKRKSYLEYASLVHTCDSLHLFNNFVRCISKV